MEISMIQKRKMTHEGDNTDTTHDMKAIHIQVTVDQKLLREKEMHLSGDVGIDRMRNAFSNTRTNYYQAVENGSPDGSPVAQIPPSPPSLTTLYAADSDKRNKSEEPSRVVRALFKDNDSKPTEKDVDLSAAGRKSPESQLNIGQTLVNSLNATESLQKRMLTSHEQHYASANSLNATAEDQTLVKVRETMEKGFWDGVTAFIQQANYDRVVELIKEVRDELCEMAPQSWRHDIIEAIDVVILSKLLNFGSLDMKYLGKIMDFALVSLQKLSASTNEYKLKGWEKTETMVLALKQELSS